MCNARMCLSMSAGETHNFSVSRNTCFICIQYTSHIYTLNERTACTYTLAVELGGWHYITFIGSSFAVAYKLPVEFNVFLLPFNEITMLSHVTRTWSLQQQKAEEIHCGERRHTWILRGKLADHNEKLRT